MLQKIGFLVHFNANQKKNLDNDMPARELDLPKFPTFSDLLRKINNQEQANKNKSMENQHITVIENTTNISIKSILRNSSDNSTMELVDQSFSATQQTKQVHFKMPIQEARFYDDTSDSMVIDETDTECSSEESNETIINQSNSQAKPSINGNNAENENKINAIEMEMPKNNCAELKPRSSKKNKMEILENLFSLELDSCKNNLADLKPKSKKNKIEILENILIPATTCHVMAENSSKSDNTSPIVSSANALCSSDSQQMGNGTSPTEKQNMPLPSMGFNIGSKNLNMFYEKFFESNSPPDSNSSASSSKENSPKNFKSNNSNNGSIRDFDINLRRQSESEDDGCCAGSNDFFLDFSNHKKSKNLFFDL